MSAAQAQFFHHPCTIVKAEPKKDRLRIVIKASTEAKDRAGEVVLKSALADRQVRLNFGREGYYDYNHTTDIIDAKIARGEFGPSELTDLMLQKVKGIIGYPDKENPIEVREDGVYSIGDLIPENDFAKEIRKGLDAGWEGWGASISGLARPKDAQGGVIKSFISLRKIAICPLQESINPETSVGILKSYLPLSDIADGRVAENPTSLPDMASSLLITPEELLRYMKRQDILWKKYTDSWEFVQNIADEVKKALQDERLKLAYDDVVSFLVDRFDVDENQAKEAANGILRNIKM